MKPSSLYHSILLRQLKRSAGIVDTATLEAWLTQVPEQIQKQMRILFQLISDSYAQSDRDLQLRTRSLELSSDELTEANERLRSEALSQKIAIDTLRQTANTLLEKSGLPPLNKDNHNLEDLSTLMKQLAQEREVALEEARKNQERFQLIIDSTEDGLWDWNVATGEVYFSPRWFGMLGYTEDEFPYLVDTWYQLTHPDDIEEIEPILKAHLQGLTTDYYVEFRMRHKNGEWRWIRSRGKVVERNESKQPIRMVGTHIDIHFQRMQEQEVREKLHFIEELLEIIPNPVYFKDKEGRYLGFNRAWEQMFGKSRTSLIGLDVFHLYEAERAQKHHDRDLELLARGGIQTFETQVAATDGTVRDTIYNKTTFSKADGSVAGILGIITDITERKRAEQELQIAKNTAEMANQAKSDFLANMSHEIRTPMNGILGMTDLALSTPLNKEQREYLQLVKASADSLLTIINDILDFSKIEAGHLHIEHTQFDLRQIVNESLRPLQFKAQEKQLEFGFEIAPTIPSFFMGDPLRIRQILINLVANAIKFTDQGKITIRVDTSLSVDKKAQLHISVQDTGIGIAPEKLNLIFESFSQADSSTTRQYGGTGLGLTISRRLAELMGGLLWVESILGTGSIFHFKLDLELADESNKNKYLTEHFRMKRVASAQSHKKLRILLAEDNLINQKLALTLLKKMGYEVKLVHDGSEAVKLYEMQSFDIILMDIQMPHMGGFEATHHIRKIERQRGSYVPIIALTAHAMSGDEEKCLAAGMDGYLTKPIDKNKLQGTIEHFINLSAL